MKYLLPAICAGFILNFFLFTKNPGTEVYPLWTAAINNITRIHSYAHGTLDDSIIFAMQHNNKTYQLNARGTVVKQSKEEDSLVSMSGNGAYYITFEKVGKEIEFHDISGEPFWKMKSREYPYLSYNGKLIILMNGDHSRIRLADYNGNIIGAQAITGRLCTVIAFSRKKDNGAVGFADGTYYFINREGDIVNKGTSPGLTVIKNMAVSNNGLFGAVLYGDTEKDYLRVIDLQEGSSELIQLRTVQVVKSPLYISDEGSAVVIDNDAVVKYTHSGEAVFTVAVPEMKIGQSVIDAWDGFYSLSYTDKKGSAVLIVMRTDGTVLLLNQYIEDSYLVHGFNKGVILAKGSTNLYCYRILPQVY